MIKVGILGSAGYTAGELLRLLLRHPHAQIKSLVSATQAGKAASFIHRDLLGDTELCFTDQLDPSVDLVFLCLGHGHSKEALAKIHKRARVIDLSNDFRLSKNARSAERDFVYGLPELQADVIKKAQNIANPGCFATAIELALLPLAQSGGLKEDIHISALTGSTGAGRNLSESAHFSRRAHNASTYKLFTHQHLHEIRESLLSLQADFLSELFFVPYRGNFTRGILATIYTRCELSLEQVKLLYEDFYKTHPFTHLSEDPLELKQVVNTNKCLLHLTKEKGCLIITSVLDNLLKGASGQAIQNLNLMYGYDEISALHLKPLAF